MGILEKLLVGGVAALMGAGIVETYRSAQETKRRRQTPLHFDERLTEQEFANMADEVGKSTPRLIRAVTLGLTVTLDVRSVSGLTNWSAQVDFNDFGRPTGRYWITSENSQSPIPQFFAKALQEQIQRKLLS